MTVQSPERAQSRRNRPRFDHIALLLQGGGALGAYQAGVYQALEEAGVLPDWVAGISIGAINAAIIAGNPPQARLDRLRTFWETITTDFGTTDSGPLAIRGDAARSLFNQFSSGYSILWGAPGFFLPRVPSPWFEPSGTIEATSYYDTAPLRATLESLVDFDRLNAREVRVSLGAVNVESGDFVCFDTETHWIGPEHVMASGALPPGFPPVEILGEYYWDGGLLSNTPLEWVVEAAPGADLLAFLVDLWNPAGKLPATLAEVLIRQKEVQFSSRTRATVQRVCQAQKMRNATAGLLAQLPEQYRQSPEARLLGNESRRRVYNIIHLIYRARQYEGDAKDYEFSRFSMREHWQAGYIDTLRTLRHPQVLERPTNVEGVSVFELGRDGRE